MGGSVAAAMASSAALGGSGCAEAGGWRAAGQRRQCWPVAGCDACGVNGAVRLLLLLLLILPLCTSQLACKYFCPRNVHCVGGWGRGAWPPVREGEQQARPIRLQKYQGRKPCNAACGWLQ